MKSQFFRAALVAIVTTACASAALAQSHTSKPFSGAKVNGGTVTHSVKDGKNLLSVSDDFKVPDTPDPHWQIIDSKGRVYLLDRLPLKGDRVARTITVPAYIQDVAKVQIYCAWAEAVLGEALFPAAMKLTN
jgi:hypothetical protein